eukprot:Pgem_evm1s1802
MYNEKFYKNEELTTERFQNYKYILELALKLDQALGTHIKLLPSPPKSDSMKNGLDDKVDVDSHVYRYES